MASPDSQDPDTFWEVLEILGERKVKGKTQYLLKWGGVNKKTGQPWPPDWQPVNNCTPDLIAEWKLKKQGAWSVSYAQAVISPRCSEREHERWEETQQTYRIHCERLHIVSTSVCGIDSRLCCRLVLQTTASRCVTHSFS
jgi:hypothetical protein